MPAAAAAAAAVIAAGVGLRPVLVIVVVAADVGIIAQIARPVKGVESAIRNSSYRYCPLASPGNRASG